MTTIDAAAGPILCTVTCAEAKALVDQAQAIERLAQVGFTGILLETSPCSGEPSGDELTRLSDQFAVHGLGLFLAVEIRGASAQKPAAESDGVVADPRRPFERSDLGETAAESDLEQGLARLQGRGVAGLLLRGLGTARAMERGAQLFARARALRPDLVCIADVTGQRPPATALAACRFDFLISSLAWWDGRAAWMTEEHDALRTAAPLIVDMGRNDLPEAARLRALALAPAAASGLIARLGDAAAFGEALRQANRQLVEFAEFRGELRSLTGPGAAVTALARASGPDLRVAGSVLVALINPDAERVVMVAPDTFLGGLGSAFGPFRRLRGGEPFAPLGPGEVRVLRAACCRPILFRSKPGKAAARLAVEAPRIAIEDLSPAVDGGRFSVKRVMNEPVVVEADVFADGHEQLGVELLWRAADVEAWRSSPMSPLGNDRWRAQFTPDRLGRHLFAVRAWIDVFGGFQRDLGKKVEAGRLQPVDLQDGVRLVEAAQRQAVGDRRARFSDVVAELKAADGDALGRLLLSPDLRLLMAQADTRPFQVQSAPQALDAERLAARFASWYELFPRSQTDSATRHGDFDDVIRRLPAVRAMGFDVVYFPPIHPIGQKNRKGRNNSLTAEPGDPGSPYAIGSHEGGHDAVHPELGGLQGFARMIDAARALGLEVALDFAVQCAPDHPWLAEHPGWFDYRADGSIKYAENPPKRYEDIVNVDFYKPDSIPGLWLALRDAVLFWIERGVRLFRVDNPHTKPLPFWEWMIADVRGRHPDAVFLAEAFTRPKVMYRLAKIGFSQSYTYFTWRHSKAEFMQYMEELTSGPPQAFFRPHFFVNTPDINPYFLQTSGRAGFLIRAALAATLSGLFGVYSGFELLEADPVPGKEEYLHSEKYEIKPRDWAAPGNIISDIAKLNRIRKANPALQSHLGIKFYNAFNDNVIYYGKSSPDKSEMILVAVSLDPHHAQSFDFEIPLWEWGLPDDGALMVEDLLYERSIVWRGKLQSRTLTPDAPYAIWRVQPRREA